jgi:hypothetical protein
MKTAVEWQYIELSKFINGKSEFTEANDILIKAQEIEKEYIVNAHYQGYRSSIGTTEISEQYYNETFKQEQCM